MPENESFLFIDRNMNSHMRNLSVFLQAISEFLETSGLADDLFKHLTIFFRSLD